MLVLGTQFRKIWKTYSVLAQSASCIWCVLSNPRGLIPRGSVMFNKLSMKQFDIEVGTGEPEY